MTVAWQSWVVGVLGIAAAAIALVMGNAATLGVESPWILLIVLPTLQALFVFAANQLKPIGGPAPGTVVSKTEITRPNPDGR